MNRNRVFAGISLITMSVLMLELSLTRLFSATMYYHFAFMAISLALFGSGASGVFIYIVQRRLIPERAGEWLSLASQLFAVTTVFALHVILTHPLAGGLNAESFYTLTIIYAATALPFFFAGCVVTLAITRFATSVSRLYLFDLAGAAAGCVLLIPAFNLIGAINTVLLVSVSAAAAAVLFNAPTPRRLAAGGSLFLVAALAIILAYNIGTHRLDIRVAKGSGETDVVFSKWNSFSRI